MNKKNISIDLRMIEHTGIGTYLQSLINPIITDLKQVNFFLLISKNIDYTIYLDSINLKNITFIIINSPIYSMREQIEIPIKMPVNIDLYWSPHYNIPILLRSNILVTIHDIYHFVDLDFKQYLRRLYAKFMLNLIKYKSNSIIVVSDFSRMELVSKLYFNEETLNTIYNGIGEKWVSTRDYKKNNQILYVGNFKKHKNLDILIDAFTKIKYNSKYELILIGGDRNSFNYSTRLKVDNYSNIKCYKAVPQKELIAYYNRAYLFVFPSTYEGFGFPPLEALACECPILISNIPVFKEIYADIACYFNPYDVNDLVEKMELLLEHHILTDRQIKKSQEFTNKYSWDKTLNQTIKLINKELSL